MIKLGGTRGRGMAGAIGAAVLAGPARRDPRTKDLVKRLRRGDIAVIHHDDLDPLSARSLVQARPAAVINCGKSVTGRYPVGGPRLLLEAGVPLFDAPETLFAAVQERDWLRIEGDVLLREGEAAVEMLRWSPERLEMALTEAATRLEDELRRFSANTLEYISREAPSVTADLPPLPLKTRIARRHALVAVRGEGYMEDIAAISTYIRDQRPVLIGVDGGADALLEFGFPPDIIIGDMDSASEGALRCGAELVVHEYADGRPSPGRARLEALGLPFHSLAAPGTSEDVAMLLAYQCGAALIVAVGTHFSLLDFLDKRRAGMASTFLTRLRVGSILVDAKGVSRLYRRSLAGREITGLVLAAASVVGVLFWYVPATQGWLRIAWSSLRVALRQLGL
jgi:uncharacterized membrane-anchored protein